MPVEVNPLLVNPGEMRLSLDGEWDFQLDPGDRGLKMGWHEGGSLGERVSVPGCWQGQGHGGDGTDEIWDFRLRARVFRATYSGTGWYARNFSLPPDWEGRRVWLNFGGVHPSADVWVNGVKAGSHSGPFVPFGFDVTDLLVRGKNRISVRVHEGERWLGHAYNWQGNWSGLYRSVELTATGRSYLDRVWLRPDLSGETLGFRITCGDLEKGARIRVRVTSPDGRLLTAERVAPKTDPEIRISMPVEPIPWSPESPSLYRVDVELLVEGEVSDSMSTRTGFVKLSTSGKRFLINGEPYYMRGTGDFCSCPETGSPDTDRDRWRRRLSNLRKFGYNYVRCQSYVPTPEYMDAADEVGLIVQLEMGMLGGWSGHSPWHVYAWPQPSPVYYPRLKEHWDRTVMRDVNHPSAVIYCMSNELGKATLYPRTAHECSRDTKAIKPNAMVIWTDGGCSPELPGEFVNDQARVEDETEKPVIQHEFRWWSAYPDVRIKGKYDGALRPYPIELAEERASAPLASRLLPTMAEVSQRLQAIEMRGKLDACRRDNPRLAGICHFNAMDIGFSPQGVIDEFYDKKVVDEGDWLKTWGDTVILIDREFDQRVLHGGEELKATLFISDFSHPSLIEPELHWSIIEDGRQIEGGEITYRHRPFITKRAGRITVSMPDFAKPTRVVLRAELREGERIFTNEWSFWSFPKETRLPDELAIYGSTKYTWLRSLRGPSRVRNLNGVDPSSVILTEQIDEGLLEFARGGGRVILAAGEGLVRPSNPKLGLSKGRYFFLPPANYPPYEDGQSGTIIEDHKMLAELPHEGYADLQLYRPIAESPPVDLRVLGGWNTKTVIRALSTYLVCHPLAYIVEFSHGRGGIIVSSLDLDQKWPESRYLLSSMIQYASGPDFNPPNALKRDWQEALIAGRRD